MFLDFQLPAKVDESVDWDVFAETNPKQCWAVSIPKETVNTRNGCMFTTT